MPGWRPMAAADLPAISAISDAVHGRYSEAVEVYAERLALYPAGCFVLEGDGAAAGYLITHPWRRDTPPKLGAMLERLPADADTCYLHDIALLPATRGTGAGRAAVDLVIGQARASGFGEITLMAVGGADSFWAAQGFAIVDAAPDILASYGPEARLMRRRLD
ncbi:GNAT family N-acetyltransferase [Sphingomonas sp. BT-65]|uniref:GNAT family N-acetyltransferase n=1 Tax=Sphingomonas sp. BT-65 TaxID=2989821 RepID=UPI002235A94A|nr:GNAT family N-acetyltransferase [Sphingomonas sp. BT-65]MCW4461693.1 GNAT family N-acetyltransferase [Sphingomonas sp. BT-65]